MERQAPEGTGPASRSTTPAPGYGKEELLDPVGLAFAIRNDADTLTIGITSDPALVTDSDRLCDLPRAGLDELRELAGVERVTRPTLVWPER